MGSNSNVVLTSRTLVGRTQECLVRIEDPRISGLHAALTWRSDGWSIRDLGSRNGTWVNYERLGAKACALGVGATVCFGCGEYAYQLVDENAPALMLEQLTAHPSGQHVITARDCISLPNSDATFMIYRNLDGTWVVEQGGEVRDCFDQETIRVGDATWRVHLPPATDSDIISTRTAETVAVDLEDCSLRFEIGCNEESLRVVLVSWRGWERLPARTYHQMMLTMASIRKADRERGVAEADCGLTSVDALANRLQLDAERLNVDICRARKQLAALHVDNAAHLFERRARSGLLRIGVRTLEVEKQT